MKVIWKTRNGSVWKNGHIEGEGQEINPFTCKILDGTFNQKGQLHGSACFKIDYSGSFPSIRYGSFSSGKEHGEVLEHVMSESTWNDFVDGVNSNPSVTQYVHTFSNGVWSSTQATNTVNLGGTFTTNDDQITNVELTFTS